MLPNANNVYLGREYYVFNTNYLEPGYPKPLTALGLPSAIDHIDAAMVWGHNSHTYFFSDTMYWKFDDKENTVELDYPRDMVMWKGIGYNIDTAFQWKDGENLLIFLFSSAKCLLTYRIIKFVDSKYY